MAKMYSGKIVYVRKNYGMLSTIIDEHNVRLYFIVKSYMVENNKFILGKYVKFEIRNMTIRYTNVVCAYNLVPSNKNPKPIKVENIKNYPDVNLRGYYDLLDNQESINEETKKELAEHNDAVNIFFLDWILFLEKETKKIIETSLNKSGISHKEFIEKLSQNKQTSRIIKDALKMLKDDTLFRTESDSLNYKEKENDPNDIDVSDTPLSLLFEQLTLVELSNVLNVAYELCKDKLDEDYKILNYYLATMLSDVTFIRNKAAHGNAVVPLILDDAFGPSYFYEMTSIYPKWNSNDKINDVENYPAFEFIRYNTRMMAKEGINLAGIDGSPLQIALYYTKSLLINQAKKSLFSLIFLLMCVFSFCDKEKYKDFRYGAEYLGILLSDEKDTNVFFSFPSDKNSIRIQLTRILIPIFCYSETPTSFKMYSSISYKISQGKQQ